MIRLSVVAAFCAAVAVAVFVLAGPVGAASHPQLIGVVGQNNAYKITLSFDGKLVKTLKAGTYTVVIHDDSQMPNYELDGPTARRGRSRRCRSSARRPSRSSSCPASTRRTVPRTSR